MCASTFTYTYYKRVRLEKIIEVLESFTRRGCESVCKTVIIMHECKARRIGSKNIYSNNFLQASRCRDLGEHSFLRVTQPKSWASTLPTNVRAADQLRWSAFRSYRQKSSCGQTERNPAAKGIQLRKGCSRSVCTQR